MDKLTKAEKILGPAGLVFLVACFLPWFEISVLTIGASLNAFEFFLWGTIPFLATLALVVWIGLKRFTDVKLPDDVAPLYLAGCLAALPLLKLLAGQSGWSRAFGLVVAALAGLAVAAGSALKFIEAGGKVDELKGQVSNFGNQMSDKAKDAVDEAKKLGDKK